MRTEIMKGNAEMKWEKVKLGEALFYEQPTKYLVSSENYNDEFQTPVLTAGKSFILGYTNEVEGIFENFPVIIFDDFTADSKYVDFRFKVKSSAMKILQVNKEKADLRFLFYLMQTLNVDCQQHKRYWISKFAELEIPLPPLSIQKRIAEILNAADDLRRKDQELLKKYDELAESVFFDMFGNPVKNEKGWEISLIRNLVEDSKHALKAGPFGSSLKKEFYTETGYKIYGQEQVIANDAFYGNYFISEKKFNELRSCAVKPHDVLISLVGSYGKTLIIPTDFLPGIINPRLMKISFNREKMNPIFFSFLFGTKVLQSHLATMTHGGTMPILNLGIVKDLKIILPPVALQNKFAEILTEIEEQKAKVQLALKESEDLFQRLMQDLFKNGQLN